MAQEALPDPEAIEPCNAKLAVLWALGLRRRYRVAGSSMEPTLRAGQSVLLHPRSFSACAPKAGDVVLIRHPHEHERIAVKRLAYVQDRQLFVVGDNRQASTDSRSYGLVPMDNLLGRIECTFP